MGTPALDMSLRLPRGTVTTKEAAEAWIAVRKKNGLSALAVPLLTAPEGNPKFKKTTTPIYGLTLSPAMSSGWNVCPFAGDCTRMCLHYAGKGALPHAQRARHVRTVFLATDPAAFAVLLEQELHKAVRKHNTELAFRLNTLSDIRWEIVAPWLFDVFDAIQWFDYTKIPRRVVPSNYHLTYSVSERSTDRMIRQEAETKPVAVVFAVKKGQPLPSSFLGMPVVDGDLSDARWLDKPRTVIGLRAKGRAIKAVGDFVRAA